VFIDGMGPELHGDPKRAQRHKRLRTEARMKGHRVVEMTAGGLQGETSLAPESPRELAEEDVSRACARERPAAEVHGRAGTGRQHYVFHAVDRDEACRSTGKQLAPDVVGHDHTVVVVIIVRCARDAVVQQHT
jgi:hypothetical protein